MMIRKATIDDREKLLQLVTELHVENKKKTFTGQELQFEAYRDSKKVMEETTSQFLSDPNFITFAAVEDDQLVGYISGQIKGKPHKVYHRSGYIEDLFVTEKFRTKGVSTRLFQKLAEEFKKRDCTHMEIDTFTNNHHAVSIYEHWGFTKRLVTFYKPLI